MLSAPHCSRPAASEVSFIRCNVASRRKVPKTRINLRGNPVSGRDGIVQSFAAEVGDVLYERHDQRMWFVLARRELRLEQSRDVKQVCGRFDGPAFFLRAAGHDWKACFPGH